MEKLENEYLSIEVSAHGAELQSIKDSDSHEYLWQGDGRYWGRRSPILFPIVCGLWEGQYRTDGATYEMGRHGFARDMDFTLLKHTADAVTYVLTDNEQTRRNYPYRFHLSVTYRLKANAIHVIWHVHNSGNDEMHFQIGAHPAFNLPGVAEGDKMRGVLRFDNREPLTRIIGTTGGCVTADRYPLPTSDGLWPFSEESFADDAIILDQCQVHEVELMGLDAQPEVSVRFRTPCVGIWSPYGKNAPFICIEPWYGIHDHAHYKGKFKDKYLMNHLQPGASFMSEYKIIIRDGQYGTTAGDGQ